jgi:hypothetical protein
MYKRYGFLLVILCLSTVASFAGTIDVSVNTSALVGAGDFYLEFTLNDGSGSGNGNNTVIVDNFDFGGGSEGGLSLFPYLGDVSGDTTIGLTFKDTDLQADYMQSFTAGGTLTFRITLPTANVDSPNPDAFYFAILDSGQSAIPTNSPISPSVFLSVDITGGLPIINRYHSDTSQTPIDIGAPTATFDAGPVPEPAMTLPMVALFGLAAYLRKRSRLSA